MLVGRGEHGVADEHFAVCNGCCNASQDVAEFACDLLGDCVAREIADAARHIVSAELCVVVESSSTSSMHKIALWNKHFQSFVRSMHSCS